MVKTFSIVLKNLQTKREIQKTAEATVDLIDNKIADKITNVSTELHSKKFSAKLRSENNKSEAL